MPDSKNHKDGYSSAYDNEGCALTSTLTCMTMLVAASMWLGLGVFVGWMIWG